MRRFVAGADRGQSTLLPECLDDFIDESNAVRAIDAFVDALDLAELWFDGVESAATGRPSYHPSCKYLSGCRNPMVRSAIPKKGAKKFELALRSAQARATF